jgi:hypothetical protein
MQFFLIICFSFFISPVFAQTINGKWQVIGTNPLKQTYKGTINITKQSHAQVYLLDWDIANVGKYGGVGIYRNNILYASWVLQQADCGIVVYTINRSNGNLDGTWTMKNNPNAVGTETATQKTGSKTDIIGTYQVQGTTATGGRYRGTLTIEAGSNVGNYLIKWNLVNNPVYVGVGFVEGNELIVAWGGGSFGVVQYVFSGNKATGKWAIKEHNGTLTENLQR